MQNIQIKRYSSATLQKQWQGTVEADDGSWIAFIDGDGFPHLMVRGINGDYRDPAHPSLEAAAKEIAGLYTVETGAPSETRDDWFAELRDKATGDGLSFAWGRTEAEAVFDAHRALRALEYRAECRRLGKPYGSQGATA